MNATAQDVTESNEQKPKLKIELILIGVIYSSICLWLFVTLILVEIRNRKKINTGGSTAKRTWDYIASRIFAIFSVAFAFMRFFVKTVLIFKPILGKISCQIWFLAGIASIPLSSVFLYAVLFTRQYILYQSVAFRSHVNPMLTKLVGISVFTFYLVANLIFMLYFPIFTTIGVRDDGFCTILSVNLPMLYPRIVLVVSMCFSQSTLVGLILYPLICHYNNSGVANNSSSNKFRNVILKLLVIAVICVVTDISTWAFVISGIAKSIVPSLINTSILINNLAVIFTFKDWKVIFFPCYSFQLLVSNATSNVLRTEPQGRSTCPTSAA